MSIDYQVIGKVYKLTMSAEDRVKAVAEKTTQTVGGKKTVGISVGIKSGRKTIYMTAAEFKEFEKGFGV
jgi:hypothetical protein